MKNKKANNILGIISIFFGLYAVVYAILKELFLTTLLFCVISMILSIVAYKSSDGHYNHLPEKFGFVCGVIGIVIVFCKLIV